MVEMSEPMDLDGGAQQHTGPTSSITTAKPSQELVGPHTPSFPPQMSLPKATLWISPHLVNAVLDKHNDQYLRYLFRPLPDHYNDDHTPKTEWVKHLQANGFHEAFQELLGTEIDRYKRIIKRSKDNEARDEVLVKDTLGILKHATEPVDRLPIVSIPISNLCGQSSLDTTVVECYSTRRKPS